MSREYLSDVHVHVMELFWTFVKQRRYYRCKRRLFQRHLFLRFWTVPNINVRNKWNMRLRKLGKVYLLAIFETWKVLLSFLHSDSYSPYQIVEQKAINHLIINGSNYETPLHTHHDLRTYFLLIWFAACLQSSRYVIKKIAMP